MTPLSVGVLDTRLELAIAEQHLALSDTNHAVRLRLLGNNQTTWDLAPDLAAGFSYPPGQQADVDCQHMAIPSYFQPGALEPELSRKLLRLKSWSIQLSSAIRYEYNDSLIEPMSICIDIIGPGSGVYDRLYRCGLPVVGVNSSNSSMFPETHLNC